MYSKPKLQNCFHFVKREHNYGPQDTPRPGPKIKDPSKLKDLLTGRGPYRHRRIVPTTPPPRWTISMISFGLVASLSCSCWVLLFSSYLDTRQDLGCFGHLFVFFLRFQPTAGERRTKEVPTRTDLPRSLECSAYVAQCYLLTECRNFIIYYSHRCRASAFRFLLTRTVGTNKERFRRRWKVHFSLYLCMFVCVNLPYIVQNVFFSCFIWKNSCAISFFKYWSYII